MNVWIGKWIDYLWIEEQIDILIDGVIDRYMDGLIDR